MRFEFVESVGSLIRVHPMFDGVVRTAKQPVILACALTLLTSNPQAQAQGNVDLELVLAVDCSGSVDDAEYKLQMAGIANALRDPKIVAAIERWASNGVAISVVEWAGERQQAVAVDWTKIDDHASAHALATQIEGGSCSKFGGTALGDMLRFVIGHFDKGPFQGVRRIIDVSGDGKSNEGEKPDQPRDAATAAGIVINGLAILNEEPVLDLYYADHVIGGSEAFLVVAKDYRDFERAVRLKLLQEIGGAPLG